MNGKINTELTSTSKDAHFDHIGADVGSSYKYSCIRDNYPLTSSLEDTNYRRVLEDRFASIFPMMKLFYIKNRIYLYDAKSNLLTEVNKNELNILLRPQNKQKRGSHINKLVQKGIFSPGCLKQVVPDDDDINSIIHEQFSTYVPRKFVLEITEDCTLSCKYCFYSKDTNIRKHSKRIMNEKIAFKAVDYYFDIYTSRIRKIPTLERKKIVKFAVPGISWWGGEPFLNFNLIKKTKEYIESLPWKEFDIINTQLVYSVATNFTILNDEIIDFLLKNNVYLYVSLDGDKNQNDTNRIFPNGSSSFDIVIENVNFMLEHYPEFCETRMIVQSVLLDNTDIDSQLRFMEEYFALNSQRRKILKHLSFPLKKEMVFLSELSTYKDIDLRIFKIKLDELTSLKTDDLIKLLNTDFNLLKEFENLLSLENALTFDEPQGEDYCVKNFSCPIGVDIIHISCNGDIHICNKTDYSFPLGNVKSGLDTNLLSELYSNYYSGFRNRCNTCWAFMFCTVCPASILYKGTFYYPKDAECERMRKSLYNRMGKYILFSQFYEFYDSIVSFLSTKEKSFLNFEGPIKINHFNKNIIINN